MNILEVVRRSISAPHVMAVIHETDVPIVGSGRGGQAAPFCALQAFGTSRTDLDRVETTQALKLFS